MKPKISIKKYNAIQLFEAFIKYNRTFTPPPPPPPVAGESSLHNRTQTMSSGYPINSKRNLIYNVNLWTYWGLTIDLYPEMCVKPSWQAHYDCLHTVWRVFIRDSHAAISNPFGKSVKYKYPKCYNNHFCFQLDFQNVCFLGFFF